MNLESIMLSEIKSEKRQILLFNMWNLKNKANVCIYIYNQMYKQTVSQI